MHSIMTKEVDCLTSDSKIKTAMEHVVAYHRSVMVVIDEDNKPIGVLSERKLLHIIAEAPDYQALMKEDCVAHMTDAIKINESATLEEALNLKNSLKAKRLVVTNRRGELLGLITQTDLISSYAKMISKTRDHLEKTVQKRTEELEQLNRKLTSMSLVDPLTGLGNRRAMQVDVMKVHAASIRHGKPYTVSLLDIDHFKKYNDHYGHQMGDQVLQRVAAYFKDSIRETDFIYRYGGEEFLILMPETTAMEAKRLMERIVRGLGEINIEHVKSPMQVITTSAGAAESSSPVERISNWRQVVELADQCLYQSKAAGRNTFSIAEPNKAEVVNSN